MSHPARVVFAGTPEFAVPALQRLHAAGIPIAAVYTQPDRPAGRGRRLTAGPVKRWAEAHGLPVEQPATLKDPEARQRLADYAADLMIVAAYGLLLPPDILALPRFGCVNIHASLLPRWRGAAPIQRAIAAGDSETGITIMQMDAGLDTGDMLYKIATAISETDTGGSLHDRLAVMGLAALVLIPLLGSFGLWDPWETHYGEVARQITERNDWISTWWGSHWEDAQGQTEGSYFYSKPILFSARIHPSYRR
jgi:methionyl-tRNA formyltransferase